MNITGPPQDTIDMPCQNLKPFRFKHLYDHIKPMENTHEYTHIIDTQEQDIEDTEVSK